MKYLRTFFTILAFILCLGTGAHAAGASSITTVYATEEAVETETTEGSDSVQLAVFMAVILLICIVAVIVAISSVTVSLPIIEFFE
jgi:uncharacterized membrane protein YidH (DUF202 family)